MLLLTLGPRAVRGGAFAMDLKAALRAYWAAGRTARADREAGARAHADLYLIKPFSPQELLEAVMQALGTNPQPG
jgi:DNA-binding response OmpR family regulator